MMVKLANDIAYVIAEGVGGDVESFVAMMNAEARRLGMRDTNFVNPNGWHHPDQQSSARDLAVLAMALMSEFGDYSDYWNTGAVQLGKQVLKNTNGLVGRYHGINGFKTGFVCASGFNVVATATRGGRTPIAVVMGAHSGAERTIKARRSCSMTASANGRARHHGRQPSSGTGGRAYSARTPCAAAAALGDDVDSSGPITVSAAPGVGGNSDGTSDRFAVGVPQSGVGGVVPTRSPSGRITLGQRAPLATVPVAFGRTPASASAPLAANVVAKPGTCRARNHPAGRTGRCRARRLRPHRSANGAIPARAFAATAPGDEVQPPSNAFGSGPRLRLQGAVQPGAATPASLRPGAAAGIKPAARNAAKAARRPSPATKPASKPKGCASQAWAEHGAGRSPAPGQAGSLRRQARRLKPAGDAVRTDGDVFNSQRGHRAGARPLPPSVPTSSAPRSPGWPG